IPLMWDLIIKSIYFVLPAYLANMAPVICDKLKLFRFLARPIDGGRKLGSQPIFGSSKTWRGLFSGALFGLITTSFQAYLYNYDFFKDISLIDYPSNFIAFGLLSGLGAMVGDLIKSFFKRRLNKKSGSSWPVFDQLDFVLGFLLFTYYFSAPAVPIILTILLLTLILHPLTNLVSYALGFKKVWW
ncbi:MAG: CDP-2,3-bis-(O-geranylgeranyl)-sn-glycerol synthase, partial [Candidatus Buchananbacteria bacterium]|nr:CDP-2,3-bis-(O-geranylgeranyl)-sn-glycerol synthase [Candidatus Buchananbacteria bacterium]